MLRQQGRVAVAVAVGLLAGGLAGTGCGDGDEGVCFDDTQCTESGEICLPSSVCGCDPAAATDSCTAADAERACHPDTSRCVATCASDTDCTGENQKCDPVKNVCRDADKLGDCTQAGNECASTQVCDRDGTKKCIDRCTSTSCEAGKACNDQSGLCEPDCTIAGNECTGTKTCHPTAKVCVESCGAGTCGTDEVCSETGTCINRCDAATDPTACDAPDTVCDPDSGKCTIHCELDSTLCDATTEFCSTTTHLCEEKCTTSNDCAGGAGFCRVATGQCETRLDITDAPEPGTPAERKVVKEDTNELVAASTLATCADAAKRDSNKADHKDGPTAFFAEFKEYQNVNDAQCTGRRATIQVAYYDYEGDFPTTAGNPLNAAIRIALSTTGDDDGYSNTVPPSVTPGSTGTTGVLEFTICRANATDARSFAVYLRDTNAHYGNTICVDTPAP